MEPLKRIRKTISYLSLVAIGITFLLFSCSKDAANKNNGNNNNNNNNNNNTGTDRLIYYQQDDYFTFRTDVGAINPANGSEAWYISMPGGLDGYEFWIDVPIYNSNNVYFGSYPFLFAPPNPPSKIQRINIQTGAADILRTYPFQSIRTRSLLPFNDNLFMFSSIDSAFYLSKYNAVTDAVPSWKNTYIATLGYRSFGLIYNNILYVNLGDTLHAINTTNGNTVWKFSHGPGYLNAQDIIASNGKLYFQSYNTSSANENIFCLDAQTGSVVWSTPIDHGLGGDLSMDENYLVAADFRDVSFSLAPYNVYTIDKNTGAIVNTYTENTKMTSSTTIRNNKVYYSTIDSTIHCISAVNGSVLWTYHFKGYSRSQPIIVKDRVWFSANKIYGLNANSGSVEVQSGTARIHYSPSVNDNINTRLAFVMSGDSVYYPNGLVIHK